MSFAVIIWRTQYLQNWNLFLFWGLRHLIFGFQMEKKCRYRVREIMTSPNAFSGRCRSNKINAGWVGGLAPPIQTVGSSLRTSQLAKPAEKNGFDKVPMWPTLSYSAWTHSFYIIISLSVMITVLTWQHHMKGHKKLNFKAIFTEIVFLTISFSNFLFQAWPILSSKCNTDANPGEKNNHVCKCWND